MGKVFNHLLLAKLTQWRLLLPNSADSVLSWEKPMEQSPQERGHLWSQSLQSGQMPGSLPISFWGGKLSSGRFVLGYCSDWVLLHGDVVLQHEPVPLAAVHSVMVFQDMISVQGCVV